MYENQQRYGTPKFVDDMYNSQPFITNFNVLAAAGYKGRIGWDVRDGNGAKQGRYAR